MPTALIGLGSNLGDRGANLRQALALLQQRPGIRLLAQSTRHCTRPVGGPSGQDAFLNAAALLETELNPQQLLAALLETETCMGRERSIRWGPRIIDLDLLLYDRLIVEQPELVVPHPRMAWRRFVLEPAAEIAPEMVHPAIGWSLARLLAHLNTTRPYVAIAGPIGAGKTELAAALAGRPGVRWAPETLDPTVLEAFYHNPAGRAWQMELEFLQQRVDALSPSGPFWSAPGSWVVTDFWFDQSLAFAQVWLSSGQFECFRQRWEAARYAVVRPKLLVWLDAPAQLLQERILRRGRPGEETISLDVLDRLGNSLRELLRLPDQGPVMRLAGSADRQSIAAEVVAAMDSLGEPNHA